MESYKHNHSVKENTSEELPSLIKAIAAHEVAGFDSSKGPDDLDSQLKSIGLHPLSTSIFGIEAAGVKNEGDHFKPQRAQSVSISMPPSPVEANLQGTIKVLFRDDVESFRNDAPNPAAIFYSQPMPKGSALNGICTGGYSRINKLKVKNFDSFKTWSGKLERQISNFRGKFRDIEEEPQTNQPAEIETLPADRYFDALEGPELDTLRASEEIILPEDEKWPFLLRFPISTFGICLGVSSQAIMWKALASSASTKFLHVSPDINLVLWFISVALLWIVAFIYTLKIIFYFEAVRREYYHPVRINFFFAPLIALLFLTLGVPPSFSQKLHASLWYVLMAPILCLEIKIYGQWMLGGERRLSKVANPSNHLSIVGNFVGALLGASMGLKEGPVFFFAVGLAHYAVLFVTLYQRLPTNETLPKELYPVFFLFVAAPSVASMAWATIQGSFGYGSRMAYFIALFLYFSLAVRINFFRGFRFSLAWWAYTFPMTSAATATIRYSDVVMTVMTRSFAVLLCVVATLTVVSLLVVTIVHAFVLGDLLPNDIAIAISETKPKLTRKRHHHKRSGSSDKNTEHHLKHANSADTDIEASLMNPPRSNNQELKKCLNQSPS